MIGYITLGTNDKERACAFYDAVLGMLGAQSFAPNDRIVIWGMGPDKPMLGIAKPYDEKAASVGNGVMVALRLDDSAAVDSLHAKALEQGGTDEGAPGFRTDNFYGAYFRDPDGNKLVAYCLK